MTGLNTKKNKHLTMDERQEIQDCLSHGMTFKATAARIGKDQTTVSKEVKKHLTVNPAPIKYMDRDRTILENPVCPKLLKAPFVCNPCPKKSTHCAFQKQLYRATDAQNGYESLLSEAREGIPLNKQDFYDMDAVISDGIKRGQHLYHILQSNNLGISKSTVYRHLHRGYLSVGNLDFPRVVKFKARRLPKVDYVPKAAKIGRSYDDFLSFTEKHSVDSWVEMDTVIGRVGGKVILTLHFTLCNFMVGLLLEDKTATQVTLIIRSLKNALVDAGLRFGDVFPLILTDNGGEFANVAAIENATDGERETDLFFCDPFQSSQKPNVEKNHTLFRDISPKGNSFDKFTQSTVNLIFSHVNCVTRKRLNGKTPYEIFTVFYSEKLAALLGITLIPAADVLQSPELFKN